MSNNCHFAKFQFNPLSIATHIASVQHSDFSSESELISGQIDRENGRLGNRGDNVDFLARKQGKSQAKKFRRHDTSTLIMKGAKYNLEKVLNAKRPKRRDEKGKLIEPSGRPSILLCSRYTLAEKMGVVMATERNVLGNVHLCRKVDGSVSFKGLVTCKNPACPICAVYRSAVLREKVSTVGEVIVQKGYHSSFLTLTIPHRVKDSLKDLEKVLQDTVRELWKRKDFTNHLANTLGLLPTFNSVPLFRVLEVTYGRHGWHPHFHIALYHTNKLSSEELAGLRAFVQKHFAFYFKKNVKKMGLEEREINEHAVHLIEVKDEDVREIVSEYMTKEGVSGGFEFELSSGILKNEFDTSKAGNVDDEKWFCKLRDEVNRRMRSKGVTFIGLLDIAEEFKKIVDNATNEVIKQKALSKYNYYSARYLEFVEVMFGNRRLNRFSKGLKAFCGINDLDDEQDDIEILEDETVEKIDVEIDCDTWGDIFNGKLRAPLVEVVSIPQIGQKDTEQIISVLGRAFDNKRDIYEIKNWLARMCAAGSYQSFGRSEEDLSLSDYNAKMERERERKREKRIEANKLKRVEENKMKRLEIAERYVRDQSKRLTARKVFYELDGVTYFRDKFELEFSAEIALIKAKDLERVSGVNGLC